ncbi:hypothetical protein [Streptomyces sp. NPDC087300]|uniref:hypothetical protein n=1 Tax=Streptomyces sp. NPDC087300 TaxID=3365780 RepID=UPI0037F3FC46
MSRPLPRPLPLSRPTARRLAASVAGGVLMAAALTAGSAAAETPGAPAGTRVVPRAETPEPCAAIPDRFEAGLCYFELSRTLEDCSPRWKRVMTEVVASGAVQFFVNPLEHCEDNGRGKVRPMR